MLRFFKTLRRQPRHRRDNVAFVIAASFTAVVAVVWLYVSPMTMIGEGVASDTAEQPRMFSSLRDTVSEQTASIREAVSTLRGGEPDTASTTPEPVATTSEITDYTLTEENRRYTASSSIATSSAGASVDTDGRRVVRIATTSASSSAISE